MLADIVRGNETEWECWSFSLLGSRSNLRLVLDSYYHLTKRKRQRNWQTIAYWDRTNRPNTNYPAETLPPLPDDVVTETKEQLIARIRNLKVQPVEK